MKDLTPVLKERPDPGASQGASMQNERPDPGASLWRTASACLPRGATVRGLDLLAATDSSSE